MEKCGMMGARKEGRYTQNFLKAVKHIVNGEKRVIEAHCEDIPVVLKDSDYQQNPDYMMCMNWKENWNEDHIV